MESGTGPNPYSPPPDTFLANLVNPPVPGSRSGADLHWARSARGRRPIVLGPDV